MSAFCNGGNHLFLSVEEVLDWPGGKSTLDRDKYGKELRQLVAKMLSPRASSRPTAAEVFEETQMDDRQDKELDFECPFM